MNPKSSNAPRIRLLAAMLSLSLFGTAAQAQQAVTVPQQLPNTGQLLQQVPQQPATVPSSDLDLKMLRPQRQQAEDTHPFLVKAIEISGNTLLPTDQLHAAVADSEGKQLTLNDLNDLADRISAIYHHAGYPLARAYVPAQTLHDGTVKLAVVEARYGKVVLQNQSAVSDGPLNATLSPLQPGKPVSNYQLERSLLLLSDIPGALTGSVVRPGDEPGTSDLVVNVTSAPRYTGTLGLDDYGNEYTGRARLGGNFNINGLLHQGDLLDFSALSSGGGMNYFQGGYRYLLNGQGTTLRAAVSTLHYHLENGLEALDAHGSALVGSLTLSQPFIRNTSGNLYGQIEFDHKLLKDDIELAFIDNNRHANVWSATLAGDQRDSTGITNFNISGTYGKITYTELLAQFIDELTTRTAGTYTKYTASVSRLQQLNENNALYFGYTQQWANKNLDTSEQFFLGGPNTVRGYDTGALAGSQGNLITAEYRLDFTMPKVPGRWQAALFADTGRVQVYKNPFISGVNSGRVSSAGLGLHWAGPDNWAINAAVSKPIGNTPDLLANANTKTRFWVQVQKGFY
ncbi:ShlB/FhaC/HecB family hemolysin secretion/activation protein [Dyella sp.]|uniref:ShlB/FhaC/HecB family hemolysin secretion/activation protein n=1 Tax=Dyella sp. TaxID=1869338 RepID=UPI002ED189E9